MKPLKDILCAGLSYLKKAFLFYSRTGFRKNLKESRPFLFPKRKNAVMGQLTERLIMNFPKDTFLNDIHSLLRNPNWRLKAG